ncbi:hypothetical protein J7J18_01160 [bacterium]|nr:hypothetical protein [bacterium]
MLKPQEGYFYNPTCGNLKADEAIKEILNYISEKPERFYDIIVGCDSSSDEMPNFPVVVVVLRVGEGGRFFIKKVGYKNQKFSNWKQRILEEVLLSCDLALFLKERLLKHLNQLPYTPRYQFRYIHADIGGNGATKDMIKEVVNLIRGNGFEPKIKPDSFVASTVADRYT